MTKKSMRKKGVFITLVLFLTVFMIGCNLVQVNPEKDAQEVVAEIGEETITKDEFNYYLAEYELGMKWQGQPMPTDEESLNQIKSQLLDGAAQTNLIVQLAKQEGIEAKGENVDVDAEAQKFKEDFQENIGQEDYMKTLEDNGITDEEFDEHLKKILLNMEYELGLQEVVLADIEVSQEEVEEYYQENQKQFDPSTIEAKHILASTPETAEEIAEKAKDGEDFNELMEEYQDQEGILEAADLGEFSYGKMVPEFSEVAFALELGEISDPVQSQFGFHVIKVENKTEKDVQSFEEVQETIEKQLLTYAQNVEYQNYVNTKMEDIELKTYPEKL